jgi:hypothetical protein
MWLIYRGVHMMQAPVDIPNQRPYLDNKPAVSVQDWPIFATTRANPA